MKKNILLLVLIIGFLMSSCAQNSDYVIKIKTNYGDMVAILYDETPKHKKNFIKLAEDNFYDSLLFHRVMKGFMIQGGDPDSKKAKPGQPLGMGGPGYTVEAEFNKNFFHKKGALAAARQPDAQNPTKASNGSQFYIVHGTIINPADVESLKVDQLKFNEAFQKFIANPANKPTIDSLMFIYSAGDMSAYQKKMMSILPELEKQTGMKLTKEISEQQIQTYTTVGGAPHLDGDYTVFGEIIQGLEIIDRITSQTVDGNNRPMDDVVMTISVEKMSKSKITKEYGYVYKDVKK
jgi:cyclophilin family peptidyl-prolyl cis-trans isomerase